MSISYVPEYPPVGPICRTDVNAANALAFEMSKISARLHEIDREAESLESEASHLRNRYLQLRSERKEIVTPFGEPCQG